MGTNWVQMTHLPKLQMSQIKRYIITMCVCVCVCGLVLMWLGEKIECLLVAVSECVRFARAAAGVSSIQC